MFCPSELSYWIVIEIVILVEVMLEESWIGVCAKLVGGHKRDDFWILENQYDWRL